MKNNFTYNTLKVPQPFFTISQETDQPNYKVLYALLLENSNSYTRKCQRLFLILTVSGVTAVQSNHGVMRSIKYQ